MDHYYNVSKEAGEVNDNGLPYGFQHEPVEGYADGYPILIDPRVSAKRIKQILLYLRDGQYLSAKLTKSVSLQLVTFNPNLKVMGYWRLDLNWAEQGTISGTAMYQGLPAVTYRGEIRGDEALQFVPELFVVMFVVAHVAMTAWDVHNAIKNKPIKLKAKVRACTHIFERVVAGKVAVAEPEGLGFYVAGKGCEINTRSRITLYPCIGRTCADGHWLLRRSMARRCCWTTKN